MPTATFLDFIKLFQVVNKRKKGMKAQRDTVFTICEWKLDLDDNMLHSLLYYNHDELCLDFMGYYLKFL